VVGVGRHKYMIIVYLYSLLSMNFVSVDSNWVAVLIFVSVHSVGVKFTVGRAKFGCGEGTEFSCRGAFQ